MRFLLDTNILYSALYRFDSNAGELILTAIQGDVELIATEHVRDELIGILQRKMDYDDGMLLSLISSLPIMWLSDEAYEDMVPIAQKMIKHDRDVPLLACALALGLDILSGDKHFTNLKTKKVKVWKLKDAFDLVKKR